MVEEDVEDRGSVGPLHQCPLQLLHQDPLGRSAVPAATSSSSAGPTASSSGSAALRRARYDYWEGGRFIKND
eukprot:11337015-Alexandrium_andersonii.AAC.1